MCVQIVEPTLPLVSKRLNPVGNVFKRDCGKIAWPPLRVAAARNEASLLKNAKVFRDSRLAQTEGLHKLRHVRVSRRQAGEDCASRGVRECAEDQTKRILFMHRHTSIYPYSDIQVNNFLQIQVGTLCATRSPAQRAVDYP